ncbi:unnamed protein product [Phytophthora lilii]|uniref:Unnamed protein product n=1 Tax=Phytophthora lilii TaxID=2077276 RepID=A0A9W6TW46_9STRA|nr:unnamed protein product [Phytophthora lilii]
MEKSYLQAQAEMTRFDAGTRAHGSEEGSNNQTPSPVVPHVVDKYDPDHPDADWGGYVRRSAKKRFYTNQSSVQDVRKPSLKLSRCYGIGVAYFLMYVAPDL